MNNIKLGQEEDIYVGINLCDLYKAFDCAAHTNFLENISYISFNMMRKYLNERKQYIHTFRASFGLLKLNISVPQGSVLAPVLFVLITLYGIASIRPL